MFSEGQNYSRNLEMIKSSKQRNLRRKLMVRIYSYLPVGRLDYSAPTREEARGGPVPTLGAGGYSVCLP